MKINLNFKNESKISKRRFRYIETKSKEDIVNSIKYLSQEEKNEKLIDASRDGYLEIVKLLIENDANINAKNIWSWTSLMVAYKNGYLNIVKYLIKKGVNINDTNKYKESALTIAFINNHKDIVELLIKAGAKIK